MTEEIQPLEQLVDEDDPNQNKAKQQILQWFIDKEKSNKC